MHGILSVHSSTRYLQPFGTQLYFQRGREFASVMVLEKARARLWCNCCRVGARRDRLPDYGIASHSTDRLWMDHVSIFPLQRRRRVLETCCSLVALPRSQTDLNRRTFAFMILGLLLIAFATVRSRLPPQTREFKLHVFVDPMKDLRFTMLIISSFLFFLGLFIPINFIEVEAMANGMSVRLSSYLLAMLNAARYMSAAVITKWHSSNKRQHIRTHNPRCPGRQIRTL